MALDMSLGPVTEIFAVRAGANLDGQGVSVTALNLPVRRERVEAPVNLPYRAGIRTAGRKTFLLHPIAGLGQGTGAIQRQKAQRGGCANQGRPARDFQEMAAAPFFGWGRWQGYGGLFLGGFGLGRRLYKTLL